MDTTVADDWYGLGVERERLGTSGYVPDLHELENFLKSARSTATAMQMVIDKIDSTVYTEKRQEEDEENRTRLAEINEWIEWADAIVKEKKRIAKKERGET
ncbi:hypothetical protein F5X97DRAFT_324891 [Nemania serpens]|nr:hypothetical protein F5X97DRAFT_324891 [Nemania serpens]